MKNIRFVWILWPSFIVAAFANGVFFTLFDPQELMVLGEPVMLTRIAVYSIGFFAFWAVTAAASALTCFIQRSAAQVNQCPLEPGERPAGCPKREESGGCC